jgi:hypothetical protein
MTYIAWLIFIGAAILEVGVMRLFAKDCAAASILLGRFFPQAMP